MTSYYATLVTPTGASITRGFDSATLRALWIIGTVGYGYEIGAQWEASGVASVHKLQPTGDAHRDRLVAARLNLREE